MTVGEVQKIFDACACDYTAISQIGAGSFGTVWLVKKHSLDDQLKAVKFLRRSEEVFNGGKSSWRDVEGVKLYARHNITHQNLIKILDTRDTGTDFFYCTDAADDASGGKGAAYVPDTLALRLKRGAGTLMEFGEMLRIGLGLLDGLRALHAAGLCHRDVKPSNVLFVNGLPVLADMGCVASVNASEYTGFTRGFIPPRAAGEKYDPIDHDLYALGKVLYSCWSGNDVCDFPQVPVSLLRTSEGARFNRFLVMQACASTRRERFASADEFAHALRRAVGGTEAAEAASGQIRRTLSSLRRRLLAWRFGTALLWAVALCVWAVFKFIEPDVLYSAASATEFAKCGNSMVVGAGRQAQWVVGENGVGIGLMAFPELNMERESTEISFLISAASGKFNLDICFYPEELGAVMNPYNVLKKENFGGACRWLTLRFRNRKLAMSNLFSDGRECDIRIPRMTASLSSDPERMNRVRIMRTVSERGGARMVTVYLDGIRVASYEEPETIRPRFALALGAVAPERIRVCDLEIR